MDILLGLAIPIYCATFTAISGIVSREGKASLDIIITSIAVTSIITILPIMGVQSISLSELTLGTSLMFLIFLGITIPLTVLFSTVIKDVIRAMVR